MLSADSPARPFVTVAICTYNRSHLLDHTLGLVARLVVPSSIPWEIVVIDNASTDATRDVLRDHASRLPIRTFVESSRGLSNARNRSVAEARGDWILFTDDDVLLEPDWLRIFAGAIERHPGVVAVGGPVRPWFPTDPDPLLVGAFPELASGFCGIDHGVAEGVIQPPLEIFGANFAVRRDVAAELKFDPALGAPFGVGEETDLVRRARASGGEVLWVPNMSVRHYVDPSRMTLSYLRRYRFGLGASLVKQEGLPAAPSWLGAPRWLWRRWAGARVMAPVNMLLGRRQRGLELTRDAAYYGGMLSEARKATRSASHEAGTGVSPTPSNS